MKIIIMSTFYKKGGAELQAGFEKNVLTSSGIEVKYLTFDPELDSGETKENGHKNFAGRYSSCSRIIRNSIIDWRLYGRLKKYLDYERPDMIHLHNITYAFNTIALACKGYYAVQTIHDYSVVCPDGGRCVLPNGKACKGRHFAKCMQLCFSGHSRDRVKLMYRSVIRGISRMFRKQCINLLISPSSRLQKYLLREGYRAAVIHNMLDIQEFQSFKKRGSSPKVLFYYGAVRKDKGILELLEAFKDAEPDGLILRIAGKADDEIKQEFFSLVKESAAEYAGYLDYGQVIHELETVFSVIIPSACMDNYPNVALEGFLTECVVCGSSRGGIPELVADRKLLFDVNRKQDIIRVIRYIEKMDEEQKILICRKQKQSFYDNNSPEVFLKQFTALINDGA